VVWACLLAAAVAVISVAGQFAPVESIGHTLTIVILSAVAVAQGIRDREAGFAWLGSFLLLFGLGHALLLVPALRLPMAGVFVFLIHSVVLLPFLFLQGRERLAAVAKALCRSAQISSVLAAGILLFHITPGNLPRLILASAVLATLWLLFTLWERKQG